MYQPTRPSPCAPVLVEVVVAEEELRLVDARLAVVDPDDVELPDLALLRLPDRADDRNAIADLPAEPLREVDADDRALPIGEPRLHLLGRQLELRVDLHERLGLDRDLREEVRRDPGRRRRTTCCAWPASTPSVALQPLLIRRPAAA